MELVYLLLKAVSSRKSLQNSPLLQNSLILCGQNKSCHLVYPNMLEASVFVPKCWTSHMKVILMKMQCNAMLLCKGCDSKMDEEISKITQWCLAYQASTVTKTRDPLIPSHSLEESWQNLAADHWDRATDVILS